MSLPNCIDRGCSTADCAGLPLRMVRLYDLPGEGPWPYCVECAETLSRGGDEDCGPFNPITPDMIIAGAEALEAHGEAVEQLEMFEVAEIVLAAALGQGRES